MLWWLSYSSDLVFFDCLNQPYIYVINYECLNQPYVYVINYDWLNRSSVYFVFFCLNQSRELEVAIYWRDWRQMCAVKFLRLEDFLDNQRHGITLHLEPQGILFCEVCLQPSTSTVSFTGLSFFFIFTCNNILSFFFNKDSSIAMFILFIKRISYIVVQSGFKKFADCLLHKVQPYNLFFQNSSLCQPQTFQHGKAAWIFTI